MLSIHDWVSSSVCMDFLHIINSYVFSQFACATDDLGKMQNNSSTYGLWLTRRLSPTSQKPLIGNDRNSERFAYMTDFLVAANSTAVPIVAYLEMYVFVQCP